MITYFTEETQKISILRDAQKINRECIIKDTLLQHQIGQKKFFFNLIITRLGKDNQQ